MNEMDFRTAVERHERELRVHCYRMLGSYDDAQDLVQDTFLRAWSGRSGYRGEGSLRAWLYRIATNACLDFLERHPRPVLTAQPDAPAVAVPWLQPYPTPSADAEVVAKETIELAFLAAIQHLSARERSVLILRDVLGWSARETAEALSVTVAAVNSGLQRARLAMRVHLPSQRSDWTAVAPSASELAVLRQYMSALEHTDDAAIAAVLREDVVVGHQAGAGGNTEDHPVWYSGRQTVIEAWAPILHESTALELRFVPTRANHQPAAGTYARLPGNSAFTPFALTVLRIDGGEVAEVLTFDASLFPAFGLPATLP